MMTKFLKKYPLSILLVAVIWYLCMFTPPHTPLEQIRYIDKWTHLVMYGGFCSVIWFEYLRRHKRLFWDRIFLFAILGPILMSGLIELVQAYCTVNRSGEWLDFATNTVGVILGSLIGYFVLRPWLWKSQRRFRR